MSDDPSQPKPVTPAELQRQYDEIYTEMLARDVHARRLNREIDRCEEQIKYHAHLRHVSGVALRAHTKLIKSRAEAALRERVGIRTLPGFKPQSETNSQFLTRMKRRLMAIEEEARRDTNSKAP
jgi:hypothetical protein